MSPRRAPSPRRAGVGGRLPRKSAADGSTGEFSRLLNQHAADALRADHVALRPEGMAELIGEGEAGRVSSTNAKTVLAAAFESGESPRVLIEREGLGQV